MEHVESSMEHEANSVSSVGSSNSLIKLVEQVECQYHLGEQVITLKSLAKSLDSSVESLDSSVESLDSSVKRLASSDSLVWIVDSSDLEQEEQLRAEKDRRVVLEMQYEK